MASGRQPKNGVMFLHINHHGAMFKAHDHLLVLPSLVTAVHTDNNGKA